VDSQRIYSITQTLKVDTLIWQTGHSGFLETGTIESFDRVLDEFDANLELLTIAYKLKYREFNRDIPTYVCNLDI
jgi:hypothetical protein